ncbi:hypothetical protein PMSD_23830 [Paenibacillus macquariensis subsp. defensor]|nr:hypothetical protein PMSD_23830 [Paenibacillus macquariensis subsp. defensor]
MAKGEKVQILSAEGLLEQALMPEDEQPYEVPSNWVWVKLGSVINANPPKMKMSDFNDDDKCSFVPMVAVSDTEGIIFAAEEREFKQVKTGYTQFVNGDVIFAKITPCMENGKSAIVEGLISGVGYGSTEFYVLRTKGLLINRLLYQLVRSSAFRTEAKQQMSGAVGQQRVPKKFIEDYPFPLPPLAEQQRIVDRIESLFAKLDQAKELAQNALDSFETRKAAILHKAFTGELTAKWREEHCVGVDSWERKPIKEYASKLNQGWSPKCESFPSESVDKWGVIKTTAIQHMDFNEIENKQLPSNLNPKKQHELKEGDILITRAGPRNRVGVCCLIKNVRPRLLLCDKAYRFNALREKAIPEFLVYQLNTSLILDEINRMKTGISDSGLNLTQEGFLSIEIKMPSLSEQEEIVRLLDGFLGKERKVTELTDVMDKIDAMKKVILARAFRGELGTNDPTEGSSVELLKQVIVHQ